MKTRISENQTITEADTVIGMMTKSITIISGNDTRMVSYRAPFHILSAVDAISNISGQSRNTLISHLLQAGIDQVRDLMDKELAEQFSHAADKACEQLLSTKPE